MCILQPVPMGLLFYRRPFFFFGDRIEITSTENRQAYMAKGRSSAVGRSSKPKTQARSRPSGLSSNKTTSKKSRESVKYGQLSRKEKTNLEEYGELAPKDLDEEEEEDELAGR